MKKRIILCLSLCTSLLLAEEKTTENKETIVLEKIQVVSIVESENPLKIIADPKNPIQPIPASDGADFLKNIPGFSVKRKGGTDGDPILRGMSGSKLGIFSDGQEIYGGCGGRMDPPTAYIFPESYDSVVITKGPQTVLVGSGFSAGVVQFEKNPKYYSTPAYDIYSSFKQGSFGRSDQFIDVSGGGPLGYAQLIATRSHSDDYKDGRGDTVNSEYTRWNTSLTLGYTPTDDTTFEISGSKGDGEAKYADRTMDASKLLRENIALKIIKYNLAKNIDKVEMQVYRNYVDHIMDNYSLREPPISPMTGQKAYSAMNPDRTTIGGNLKVTTEIPSLLLTNITGIDFKEDEHTGRSAMMKTSAALADSTMLSASRQTDFDFSQMGFFNESTIDINEDNRIIAGIRLDKHEVTDKRTKLGMLIYNNPNYNKTEKDTLTSGFIRYEKDIPDYGLNTYIGFGHAERFADYWERTKYNLEGITNANKSDPNAITSQNTPEPEKTNQIDIGANWATGDFTTSISMFYSKVNDYILNRWFDENGNQMTVPYGMGTTTYTTVSNIDATIYGGELSASYNITNEYKIIGSLTHVIGKNDTDNKPLAQQPPLEGKLSVMYDDGKYSAGLLARFISKQDRYDIGAGSIVMNGVDKGETPGASIFSINGGYKYNKNVSLSFGVDNLFDKAYIEHLSNSNVSSATTFMAQERIYEPGRNVWFELKTKF
ncbi:MAG: TonB-dependent copper receptor [Candidatus Marinarcus sp.]|uniref:TonB-dependent copper receptor n=1 Tax=Candidatus Marinarcus sp. TaxID=3100987 RepID=UPI003AFF7924